MSERKKKWRNVTIIAAKWTALGVFGGPGVSAPSPVLERMVIMEKKLVSVNAIPPDTGERMIVIQPGLKKRMTVQEKEGRSISVPKTATGTTGILGLPAASLVVEEQELEFDSVTDLSMEERIVLERQKKPRSATLRAVQLMVPGALGGPGVSAPSPVLERMESLGKNPVRVNVLPLNSEGRTVIQLGMKRLRLVLEKGASTLSVPKTATGTNGVLGLPAAGLVVGEQKEERDFATNLDMEEMNVKETERRPQAATLMAVLLTAVGKNGRPGAAVA